MTKEQAAKALGISPRSVIRFAQRGMLKVVYAAKQNGGKVALYDPADVAALKIELEAEKAKPRTPPPRRQSDSEALVRAGTLELQPFLERLIEAVTATATPREIISLTDLSQKLTVSLTEAAKLSGLSENFVRKAIQAEQLRAVRGRSRGWSIKASDLRAFVEGL